MFFDFAHLSANNRYHLITQTVVPRPIAWILTKNTETSAQESYNLAPFSYFTALSSDPALLVVSIGNKSATLMKDTKLNLCKNKECILHIPSIELADKVNKSAANLEYGESELGQLGLHLTPYTENLPRIQEAKIAMHCTLYDVHELNDTQTVCYLEVQSIYMDDELVTEQDNKTLINCKKLNPLSRLGGSDYTELGKTITIKRPL